MHTVLPGAVLVGQHGDGHVCDCHRSVYCCDCGSEVRRARQFEHHDAGHKLIAVICSRCEPQCVRDC